MATLDNMITLTVYPILWHIEDPYKDGLLH